MKTATITPTLMSEMHTPNRRFDGLLEEGLNIVIAKEGINAVNSVADVVLDKFYKPYHMSNRTFESDDRNIPLMFAYAQIHEWVTNYAGVSGNVLVISDHSSDINVNKSLIKHLHTLTRRGLTVVLVTSSTLRTNKNLYFSDEIIEVSPNETKILRGRAIGGTQIIDNWMR